MPNRILKESICVSDDIAELTWFEEVLFYRLIVSCDDFGRFDGRALVIKNRLFPLRENLTVKTIEAAINKLETVGLVALYVFEGKPYLHLPTWNEHQSVRAKKSKYPAPEESLQANASKCMQMHANAPVIQSNPNPIRNPKDARAELAQRGFSSVLEKTVNEWLDYKAERRESYKPTGLKSLLTEIENNVKKHGEGEVCALIRQCMANGWKGIIFDKLGKGGEKKLQQFDERSYTAEELSKIVYDPVREMLEGEI